MAKMKIVCREALYLYFKNKYLWKAIDYDKVYWFQCVDLAKQYAKENYDEFLWSFWGSAYSGFENKSKTFDLTKWKRVDHFKWNIPIAWDLIFWKPTSWNKYWHVWIAWVWSNTEKLFVLEQNYVSENSSDFWKWRWEASIKERVRDYKNFAWSWRYIW